MYMIQQTEAAMKPLFIALLPIFLFLYFRTTATAKPHGTLTGKITDTSGKPIPWAGVWLSTEHRGAICMNDGTFSIAKLSAGCYCATIFYEKYETVTVPFTIVADSTTDIRVSLTPQPVAPDTILSHYGTLQGVITDTNGRPIIGTSVRIMGSNRGAYTKPDGAYKVIKVKPGFCVVQVTSVGFQPAEQEVTITASETTTLSFALVSDFKHADIFYFPEPSPIALDHSQIGTIRVITGDQLYHSP